MELKKLLVNDKITASYKTDVSQELFQKMNFEKLLVYQVFKKTGAGADPGLFKEGVHH